MKFSERIRKLRKENNLTQKELAENIGVDRATVAGYETKGKEPSYSTLRNIANFFGVSIDYLIGNSNIKEPAEIVEKAISDNPDLLDFWNKIKDNQNKKKLIQQINKVEADDEEYIRHIISTLQSLYKYKGKIKDSEND